MTDKQTDWMNRAKAVEAKLNTLAAPVQRQQEVAAAEAYLGTMTAALTAYSDRAPGRADALKAVEWAKARLIEAQDALAAAMADAQALIAAHANGGTDVAAASTDPKHQQADQALSHLQWETTINHLQQENAAAVCKSTQGDIWDIAHKE